MIEFTIEDAVPSLNRLLRMHWYQRRRLIKKWEWLVFAEVYRFSGGPMAFPAGKVKVSITRCYRRVPLDEDNLHGAAKLILDALKACRILVDDSPAHVALICDQIQGAPRTTIRISPINSQSQAAGSSGEPLC